MYPPTPNTASPRCPNLTSYCTLTNPTSLPYCTRTAGHSLYSWAKAPAQRSTKPFLVQTRALAALRSRSRLQPCSGRNVSGGSGLKASLVVVALVAATCPSESAQLTAAHVYLGVCSCCLAACGLLLSPCCLLGAEFVAPNRKL